MEKYLKSDDLNGRKLLAMIRSGTNKLKIETGRYENRKVIHRICNMCNDGVEDEEHFLNTCQAFEDIRRECKIELRVTQDNKNFKNIMFGKGTNKETTSVIKYIKRAMAKRERIQKLIGQ